MTKPPPQQRRPRPPRPTVSEQWRAHGELPPVERWTRRAGMILGGVVGAVLLALLVRVVGHMFITVWNATGW